MRFADAVNIFSMMEVDALRSTRVHADMLETVEILCGSMDIGDIDAKDASNPRPNLQESFAIVRDALLMENSRQKFELVAKARKLAFQTSRDSINVREEGTFPFEHELALGMPLILPSLVAFVVGLRERMCSVFRPSTVREGDVFTRQEETVI